MKQKIKYADMTEMNGEPVGKPGAPVHLDFLPGPEQVRRALQPVKVTIELEPTSAAYYRREARRRGESASNTMRRVLRAHALAGA